MQNVVVVAVIGRLRDIAFPPVCVNCAQPASARMPVHKTISYGEDGGLLPSRYVESVAPLFCQTCIEISQRARPSDPTLPFKRILRGWILWLPIAATFAAGSWALDASFPAIWRIGLAAFFWSLTAWCCSSLWRQTRYLAVPPPDSVTSAIYFSPNQSRTFEPQWRKFTFRNPDYAEQFRRANQRRLWSSTHPAAQRAIALRYWGTRLGFAVLLIVAIFGVADEFDIPLWSYLTAPFR